MKRKIDILVKETGITPAEAEEVIKSSNNLIDAIRYVKENMNLSVIKILMWTKLAKFLVAVIVKRNETIYETKAVVTRDPSVIEIDCSMDYFDFLSLIYRLRSDESSHIFLTAHFEELIAEFFRSNNEVEKLPEFLLDGGFEVTHMKYVIDELKLGRYLGFAGSVDYSSKTPEIFEVNTGFIPGDFLVRKLKTGTFIYVYIDDEREIAKEIRKILGGYRELPLKVPVVQIDFMNGFYIIRTKISNSVYGSGRLEADSKIAVVKTGIFHTVKSLFR